MKAWQRSAPSSRRGRRGRKGQQEKKDRRIESDSCKYSLGASDNETLDLLRGSTLIDDTLTEQHLAVDPASSHSFNRNQEISELLASPDRHPSSISGHAGRQLLTEQEQTKLIECGDVTVLKKLLNSSKKCEELASVVKKQDMLLYELVAQNMQLKDELQKCKAKTAGLVKFLHIPLAASLTNRSRTRERLMR